MEHLIAYNPYKNGNKGSVSSQPLSVYDKTIAYPWMADLIAAIRGGNDELKKQLPFRCAHYYQFKDNRRSQKNAVPESFLFQTTIDVDDKEYVDKAIEKARELNCSNTVWKGALLHLEYSARKKLHIDIRMPIGMTIEETQRAYCEALGVPYDESCISPERMLFITDKESEIYRSPHWYEVLPENELSKRRQAFLDRGLSIDGRAGLGTRISPISRMGSRPEGDVVPQISKVPQISQIHADFASQAKLEQGVAGDNESSTSTNGKLDSVNPANVNPASEKPASENEKSVRSVKSVGDPKTVNENDLSVKSVRSVRSVCDTQATTKNLAAFDLFREAAGLKDVDINTQGSRHSSLLAIMSAGASRVMPEEELQAVVALKMPAFSGERDCQQLIHDFYAKYGDSSKPMSQTIIRINAQAERCALGVKSEEGRVKNSMASPSGPSAVGQDNSSLFTLRSSLSSSDDSEEDYPAPPPMPEKLPKLVELLVSRTPEEYKPAVAHAIFPPLATHLWQTRFNYIDNVEHEATLMCCLLAGTGAGKSCVQKPIRYIMADIRQRDAENLKREKEWKDEITRKGANKDKRKRPQGLVIQEIDADMTNPAFVMRTAEAEGHFLYTSLNELDQFDALKGTGNQQFRIMCYAFDPENQYGQTRVGTQSVTERVTIRFNWNASTTIQKGQKYFSKVLTDGPLSRINFCTIPEREIGEEMPIYGTYDEEFKEKLKPYIDNLCKATGLIDCPEAFSLAKRLKDENAEFAKASQNRIYENLSFRANVIAYLKACVLYVANGYQWEPEMEDFIRWSEQYDLYCKMYFFADAIMKSNESGDKSNKRGPINTLMILPDIFTEAQALQARQSLGMTAEGTNQMIKNWLHRKYIRRYTPEANGQGMNTSSFSGFSFRSFSFEKLKYRSDGVEINE